MPNKKLKQVISEIDRLNGEDPRKVQFEGSDWPFELAYSQWLTDWVKKLAPDASDELVIAARGQHVTRWEIPRDRYPKNKKGYLNWREKLKDLHAQKVTDIMKETGYPNDSIAKVDKIIRKKDPEDLEAQIVEDALCLVFLEHQFVEMLGRESAKKMTDILQKSWKKMSDVGRKQALEIPLPENAKVFLEEALS